MFWLIMGGGSLDFFEETFLFLRQPPPTGMLRRVPPLVQ